MIGDTGLLNSRMFAAPASTQAFFHNHIYKIAENNAVTPQDRLGFNFNYLSGAFSGASDGTPVMHDLFEYRFFAEKTFCDGDLSVDLMVPFYETSEYDQGDFSIALNGPQTRPAFGDLAFGLKYLLFQNHRAAFSAGLRVEAPTNDEIVETTGTNLWYTSFSDNVWHFTPYAAMMLTPSDRLFFQSFLSYRLNSGKLDREPGFTDIREQTFLMADLSMGYWLYRNPANRGLTALVPMVELHYTGAYDEEDPADTVNGILIGHTDVLNLTAGVTAFFNDRFSMTAGAAVPLRDKPTDNFGTITFGSDRRYDWSLLVNVNYYFGR